MSFPLTPLQTLNLETVVSIVAAILLLYAVIRIEALHRRFSVLPKPVAAVKPAPVPKLPPKPNPIVVAAQHIGAGISAGIAAAKAPVAKSTEPVWPVYDPSGSLLSGEARTVAADVAELKARQDAATAAAYAEAHSIGALTPNLQPSLAPQPEPTHVEVPIDPVPVAVVPAPAPVLVTSVAPAPEHIVLTPAPESAPNLQPGVTAEAAAAFDAALQARNAPPPAPARVILNADGKPIA